MNAQIEKLRKIEDRAQMLADLRYKNESKWDKAVAEARQTPEWSVYCKSKGIVTNYNYGDLTA